MGQYGANDTAASISPLQSLTAVSATGAGLVLDNGSPRSNHALIVLASAGVTAGTVAIDVSLDNVNFLTSTATVSTTSATTFGINLAFVARYIRARVTVAITGGSITAWVQSSVG